MTFSATMSKTLTKAPTKKKALSVISADVTALTVLPPAGKAVATLNPDFDYARQLKSQLRGVAIAASGLIVFWGLELKRLKKLHGIQRGGDRKSKPKSLDLIETKPLTWEQIVKAELDISDETAATYIKAAEGCKGKSKPLQKYEEQLLTTPFSSLPEAAQAEIFKSVKGIADGHTIKELFELFGLSKKHATLGPNRHPGGNDTKSKTTPEQDAQSHFAPLLHSLTGLRIDSPAVFERRLYALPLHTDDETVACLASLITELKAWIAPAEQAQKAIAKALHGQKATDPAARLQQAQAAAMKAAGIKAEPIATEEDANS